MNKFLVYLQQHIRGEVTDSRSARRYFSYDGSIFSKSPRVIVYPRDSQDVRKTMLFVWQLAQRGRKLSVTPRGMGTNHTGSALSDGVMMVMPAHMDRLLKVDLSKGQVTVQPGLNFRNLQDTLYSFDRYLPCYPNDFNQTTIGAAIADNASGERAIKYGDIGRYVREVSLVLANGEQINVKEISARELERKKTLKTLEGKIYRDVDQLIQDNQDLVNSLKSKPGNTGYNIASVYSSKGRFSLLPLVVGSQGTLGVITQATLKTKKYSPGRSLSVISFRNEVDLNGLALAAAELGPSVLEYIDKSAITSLDRNSPSYIRDAKLKGKSLLIVEFDDRSKASRARKVARLRGVASRFNGEMHATEDEFQQDEVWRLLSIATSAYWSGNEGISGAPIIEDAVVPIAKLNEFMAAVKQIRAKHNIDISVWGGIGTGNMHAQPMLEMALPGDARMAAEIMTAYYRAVTSLGGSISGEYNEGLLRAPFVQLELGSDGVELMRKVKSIFDPHNLLNPDIKTGIAVRSQMSLVSSDFMMRRGYDFLPYI